MTYTNLNLYLLRHEYPSLTEVTKVKEKSTVTLGANEIAEGKVKIEC